MGGLRKVMVKLTPPDSRLTPAYQRVFQELSDKSKYQTYSVAEFYCDYKAKAQKNKVNVVVRVDVDDALHLTEPLAHTLDYYGIHASHYFLTDPMLHYDIWSTQIPRNITSLGQEVGIHSDHYFQQITTGIDGLQRLKDDIKKMSDLCGHPIRGMTHHGHDAMDKLNKSNWDLVKNITSSDLGLEYHENLNGLYIKPSASKWEPSCDIRISDYLGFSNSWGWNYYPEHPLRHLKNAKPGDTVHLAFHTKNAFNYWQDWSLSHGEAPIHKERALIFLRKSLSIRWHQQVLNGKNIGWIAFHSTIAIASYVLAKGIGLLWKRPPSTDPDITWETSRNRLYDCGLPYWENELVEFGLKPNNSTVVEVGSGNGQWLLAFAKNANKVIGVEPNDLVRNYAKGKIAEEVERSKKITLHASSAENLPVKDAIADIVLCAGVFMFTNQQKALTEMVRVLKPGGTLCITANGLGYFVMYILDGLRYRNVQKMRYGLAGFIATIYKWCSRKHLSKLTSAVSHNEIKRMFEEQGLTLNDTKLWLDKTSHYPLEHMGFATNYAFIATKNDTTD